MFNYGKRSLGYLNDPRLHPKVKEFMEEVLKASTVDIAIIDGARDVNDQQKLFKQEMTEMDGIKELSDHQIEKYPDNLARAIDAIPYVKYLANIWNVKDAEVTKVWLEMYRAILRVDRLWKQKGIDVGLELGLTYNIGDGRDYPHISFKLL